MNKYSTYGENLGTWYPLKGYSLALRGERYVVIDDDDKIVWALNKVQNVMMEKIKRDYCNLNLDLTIGDDYIKITTPYDEVFFFYKDGGVGGDIKPPRSWWKFW